MSKLQPLRWEGDTAYCGKVQVADIHESTVARGVWFCNWRFPWIPGVDLPVPAGRDACIATVNEWWKQFAAALTAQPEPAEQKVKARWKPWATGDYAKGSTLYTDYDECLGGIAQLLVYGEEWRVKDKTGEIISVHTSEAEAKQALLDAVGAQVITLPENLTTLENADTGHDQPKGA